MGCSQQAQESINWLLQFFLYLCTTQNLRNHSCNHFSTMKLYKQSGNPKQEFRPQLNKPGNCIDGLGIFLSTFDLVLLKYTHDININIIILLLINP